jgi:DNA helicase-2/ATP-dependent DNA helicase PcrA
MRVRIPPDEWRPVGVEKLEDAALEAVCAMVNTVVVAGPGAGKTELLAQRACYLLQTGLCAYPRQILAISFKRDAARNLAERVRTRCGPELASRFHSYTFDALAKGLIDRFRLALPKSFCLRRDYQLNFELNSRNLGEYLRDQLPEGGSTLDESARQGINGQRLYEGYFIGRRLEANAGLGKEPYERAAAEIWNDLLHRRDPAQVTFPMIGRLAELVLRSRSKILTALRAAYAFVFLDEFQDTSVIHYDLVATAFLGSRTIITAVGDNKQRVNKWAGAMDGIFDRFCVDFGAQRIDLLMNYRSAPQLVRIQAVFAAAIDKRAPKAIPATDGEGELGECRALLFPTYQVEAAWLAEMIKVWMAKDGLLPRDVCILCRQRPAKYAEQLMADLRKRGIRSRVENELQDLLAEPLTSSLIGCLRMVTLERAPHSRSEVVDLLCQLRGEMSEAEERTETRKLDRFLKGIRNEVSGLSSSQADVDSYLKQIVDFLGELEMKALFPQYTQGSFFADTLEKIGTELSERLRTMELGDALDDFVGATSLPIMTMHKSKGLEYHTVVFIGLEDSALFGYSKEPTEETCGFFVALSRAKRRAVFTFSRLRPDRSGRIAPQARTSIKRIYDLLESAGVTLETIGQAGN